MVDVPQPRENAVSAADSGTADDVTRDGDEVERHPCPRCDVAPGSPCRSRSGAVAGTYHTGRFTKVPRLAKRLRIQTPADRSPGQPWRPGTPPPAPVDPDRPAADIRIGNHGGRPTVSTDDMIHTVLRRRAAGEPVDKIRKDLIIPSGKRKGHNPSLASVYRALAEYEKAQRYPDAVEQARDEYAALHRGF
jgi:hypothetical protein